MFSCAGLSGFFGTSLFFVFFFCFLVCLSLEKKRPFKKEKTNTKKNQHKPGSYRAVISLNSRLSVVFQISLLFLFNFFHFRFCYSIKKWTFYSPRTWPKVAMANHLNREVHGALYISTGLKFERPWISCVKKEERAFGMIFFSFHLRGQSLFIYLNKLTNGGKFGRLLFLINGFHYSVIYSLFYFMFYKGFQVEWPPE